MIERVCRAIAADVSGNPILPDIPCGAYRSIARAAIEAMREPTRPMLLAVWEKDPNADPGYTWRDMIDAALLSPSGV